jgi:hypothetical protein
MHKRSESGIALPTPVVMLTLASLLVAAIAFFMTRGINADDNNSGSDSSQSSGADSSEGTSGAEEGEESEDKPEAKPIQRKLVTVRVLNATSINGLAGEVTTQVKRRGWRTDPAANAVVSPRRTTIYYPSKLERAAQLLGKDLNISELRPTKAGMPANKLTLVLTGALR